MDDFAVVKLEKCLLCGEMPHVYSDMENPRPLYFVKCSCGQKSHYYSHMELAVTMWNNKNSPKKMKPKCGRCGTELNIGFATCPKCGTEIEWQ